MITIETLNVALQQIASGRADRSLEDRYLKAIGNSSQRETVLRIFASATAEVVHTSLAYPEADRQQVGNPSYWVADLQKEAFGAELEKVADQYYKVSDPLFRAYVSATPARLTDRAAENASKGAEKNDEFVIIQLSDVHFGS
ncbi:hypothetical protein EII07_28750, partial [Klebsiella pneumoniae]|uniref:hypothetical protein n=1 Tax=Klebsiella pneumoniae TaxID=573 RepID=UPI0015F7D933